MKNDKSQFVVRTSDFYLSLVICHLPFDPRLVAKDFSSRNLRALGALRGFAVNPGLDFHREGAKHAKKTRRTLVWLRLCCSVRRPHISTVSQISIGSRRSTISFLPGRMPLGVGIQISALPGRPTYPSCTSSRSARKIPEIADLSPAVPPLRRLRPRRRARYTGCTSGSPPDCLAFVTAVPASSIICHLGDPPIRSCR